MPSRVLKTIHTTGEVAAPVADIFVTATGNEDVISHDHMAAMKDQAIVCNIGHFDNEIEMAGLKKIAGIETVNIKPEKIGALIGPGGSVIRKLQEETLTKIAVEEDRSLAVISGGPGSKMDVAEQMVRAAEGYALERENRALGDARRFEALVAEYRKAPEVTRKRMYLETMTELLPQLGTKVILDEKARGVLPLLQLDDVLHAPLAPGPFSDHDCPVVVLQAGGHDFAGAGAPARRPPSA